MDIKKNKLFVVVFVVSFIILTARKTISQYCLVNGKWVPC